MPFNPDTKVEDCVALIIDKDDSRYGQLAKLLAHDWKEYGNYFLEFLDGKKGIYPDLLEEECYDVPNKVLIFYRYNNTVGEDFDFRHNAGPRNLRERFIQLNVGKLEDLANQYKTLFGESFE